MMLTSETVLDPFNLAELDCAVVFHYGRSDLSVDYNGAVVGPEELKQIFSQFGQVYEFAAAAAHS